MAGQWTPEDRERKWQMLERWLRSFLAMIEGHHPQTCVPCTRQEAIWVLRSMQGRIIKKYEEKYGPEVAARYRQIIDEVLEEFQRQAEK